MRLKKVMRWAWSYRDRGEEESLLERTRGSRSELRLVADWLTQLNPLSDTCVCHVWEREREREAVETQRERETEQKIKKKEGERAPWKQLQQHKMEFVSTLPKLWTFSIHLFDTADFPPHIFFFFLHLEWLCTNYKHFEYKMKLPCCLHLLRILPQISTKLLAAVNIKEPAWVVLQYLFLVVSNSHEITKTNNFVSLSLSTFWPILYVALSPKHISSNWKHIVLDANAVYN